MIPCSVTIDATNVTNALSRRLQDIFVFLRAAFIFACDDVRAQCARLGHARTKVWTNAH
jgi:hypothetical protein